MPYPAIGPKMFWAGPNFLCKNKNWFLYCARSKLLCRHKNLWGGTKCNSIFGLAKTFWNGPKCFGICRRTRKLPNLMFDGFLTIWMWRFYHYNSMEFFVFNIFFFQIFKKFSTFLCWHFSEISWITEIELKHVHKIWGPYSAQKLELSSRNKSEMVKHGFLKL